MNRQRPSRHVLAALLFTILLLAACGGDGEASVDTVPPVSSSSTTTIPPTSSTTTTSTTEPPEFVGEPEFDSASSVSTVGIDVVTFGMTVAQADAALGGSLVPVSDSVVNDDCYQIRPAGGPSGVLLTVTAGTIERVDVSTDEITTRSGAGVGMSEDDLFALFGERLTSTPIAGGNSIMFTPADEADAAFRVIFDTDGEAVTTFRSGRVPQIEPTVPCS